jgi:hypothetical protein
MGHGSVSLLISHTVIYNYSEKLTPLHIYTMLTVFSLQIHTNSRHILTLALAHCLCVHFDRVQAHTSSQIQGSVNLPFTCPPINTPPLSPPSLTQLSTCTEIHGVASPSPHMTTKMLFYR